MEFAEINFSDWLPCALWQLEQLILPAPDLRVASFIG
jgi:hypothetical protein